MFVKEKRKGEKIIKRNFCENWKLCEKGRKERKSKKNRKKIKK